MDHTEELPAVLSLCTGIRGLERGLNRAIGRTRTLAHVEIEAFAIENLLQGMEAGILDAAPIWSNLKTFPSYPFRNKVDILLGGYPCQPFSTAGKRGGKEDPRHLWPHIEFIIDAVRPLCCFFENVSGHLTLGFDQVYQSLSDLDYRVEAGIFTAEEVGATHERERLFILAILADTNGSKWGKSVARRNGYSAGKVGIQRSGQEAASGSEQCCQEVANAIGEANRGAGGQFQQPESKIQAGSVTKDIVSGHGPGYSRAAGVGQADSCCTGLEGERTREIGTEQEQSVSTGFGCDRWPTGPEQPQQAWESPRVISRKVESDMGLSAHGYSFREDILRALGNSVVEQTAELAFRTLLEKHLS